MEWRDGIPRSGGAMPEPLLDKMQRLRVQIQKAKAQAIQSTASPDARSELMSALCLTDELLDDLTVSWGLANPPTPSA